QLSPCSIREADLAGELNALEDLAPTETPTGSAPGTWFAAPGGAYSAFMTADCAPWRRAQKAPPTSAARTPTTTIAPPSHSRAPSSSRPISDERTAVKTGSSAKMTAARTAVVRTCAQVWTEMAKEDARAPLSRTPVHSAVVGSKRTSTKGREQSASSATTQS